MKDLQALAGYWRDANVLVAQCNDRIVGSVMFYPDASSEGLGLPSTWAGFHKLAVQPQMRGRGVGRRLVENCIAAARKDGVLAIGIHTASFMRAACDIYESLDFQRCPTHDLKASGVVGADPLMGDFEIIAYRLNLDAAW